MLPAFDENNKKEEGQKPRGKVTNKKNYLPSYSYFKAFAFGSHYEGLLMHRD